MNNNQNQKEEASKPFNLLKIPLLGIASLFIAFITITENYFPFLGLFVGVVIYNIWLIFSKKEKSVYDYGIFLASSGFALNFIFKTDPTTIFINFIGIIYTQSYLIKNPKTLWQAIFNPWYIFILNLLKLPKNQYLTKLPQIIFNPKTIDGAKKTTSQIPKIINFKNFLSIVLTFFVLLLAIPILMSANPIFSDWIINTLSLNFVFDFLKLLFTTNLIFKFIFAGFIYLNLSLSETLILNNLNSLNERKHNYEQKIFNLNIPKIGLGFIILVFFASQINLYFIGLEGLYERGYNMGSLNREIFIQLGFIAALALSLIYFDIKNKIISIGTSIFLILESLILIGIATHSDITYIQEAGFTFIRLYGFSYLATISFAVLATSLFLNKSEKKDKLIQILSVGFSAIWITTNFINFGRIIYDNPPREHDGIAIEYLGNLNTDSGKLSETVEDLELKLETLKETKSEEEYQYSYEKYILENQKWKKNRLQEKYNQNPIWTFNLAEYKEYQKIQEGN